MSTRELRAKITADTAGYRRGMAEVRSVSASTAAGVAAAFASVLSARAIAGQLKQAAAYGDSLDKIAKRASLTVEGVQRLGLAAELSGSSFAALEKAIRRATQTIYDAENNSAEAVRAFRDLGVSAESLRGLDTETQFRKLAESLAAVEDESTRTALALKIFGRGGAELLPMLTDGAAGFRAVTSEADALGMVTQRGTDAAAKFTDAMTRLATSSKAARSALATEAMEALADVLDDMAVRIGELQKSGDLEKWGKDIAKAVTAAAVAIGEMTTFVRDHADVVKAMLATWAGWKVWTLAASAVIGAGNALAALGRAMATETVVLKANTAAQYANTAARKRNTATAQEALAQLQLATVGIEKASAGTRALASGMTVAGAATSKFGAIMGGLKMVGYLALFAKVADTLWEISQAIDAVGEAKKRVGVIDKRSVFQRARDYLPEWMGGGMGEGEVFRVEAAELDPDRKRKQTPQQAANLEARRKAIEEAEQKKAEWFSRMATLLEDQRRAARRAAALGDMADTELYRLITSPDPTRRETGADINRPVTSADVTNMVRYLESILPGDPEGALEIVRRRDEMRREKIQKAAEATAAAWRESQERARQVIRAAISERAQIVRQIEDMQDRAEFAERQERARRRAARLDRRAAELRAEAADIIEREKMPASERRRLRREEAREEREEARIRRALNTAYGREQEGRYVSRRGRALLSAWKRQQAAGQAKKAAEKIRDKAEAAAMAAAMEPLRAAMKQIDATLRSRLPQEES